MHPPPFLVIHLLFGRYNSQSGFIVKVFGALEHNLLMHPLKVELTVQEER
jgi:hypothetical protein